jgi:hypothetical protein
MNDDLELTDEQLRLATTRSLPAGAALDAETAASRDDFLAVGSALESAAGQFEEAALVGRLQKSCLELQRASGSRSKPRLAGHDWWAIACGAALAASALFAIARIAFESRQRDAIVATAIPGGLGPTRGGVPHMMPASAWNDPLDDEIALAAATIDQFASRNRGFDDSLFEMNERLEAMSQELLGESL